MRPKWDQLAALVMPMTDLSKQRDIDTAGFVYTVLIIVKLQSTARTLHLVFRSLTIEVATFLKSSTQFAAYTYYFIYNNNRDIFWTSLVYSYNIFRCIRNQSI